MGFAGWSLLGGRERRPRPVKSSARFGQRAIVGPQSAAGQSNREKNSQSDSDDHVHHHAALGVLIGNSQDGVSVVGIIPGSPAELAGLRVGDVIRGVGDQRIRTTQGLTEEIREYTPGSAIDLSIRRDGERRIVTATLASQESTFGNRHQANRMPNSGNDGSPANKPGRNSGTADRGLNEFALSSNKSPDCNKRSTG